MAKTKTQAVIDAIMAATDEWQLDQLEGSLIPSLSQRKLRDAAQNALAARRLQLNAAPVYRIGAANVKYLCAAMADDDLRPALRRAFVFAFNTDILQGAYLLTTDTYRAHMIFVGKKMPVGQYHLYGECAYRISTDAEYCAPNFNEIFSRSRRDFLTKARLAAARDIDGASFKAEKYGPALIMVSADGTHARLGGTYSAAGMSQVLRAEWLTQAITDQECTILLGYETSEPLIIIDRLNRIAVIFPIQLPTLPRRAATCDVNHFARKHDLCAIMAACYESAITMNGGNVTIDGKGFMREGQAVDYFLYDLVELDPHRFADCTGTSDPIRDIRSYARSFLLHRSS